MGHREDGYLIKPETTKQNQRNESTETSKDNETTETKTTETTETSETEETRNVEEGNGFSLNTVSHRKAKF